MLQLTRKDICSALQVSEHRIRAWMARLPFRTRSTQERKPRVFDATDLLLLAIAQTLEDHFMLKSDGLDRALPAFEHFLRRPLQHRSVELLFISMQSWRVDYLSPDVCQEPGIVVDISQERERIARFLGLTPAQEELALGPLPLGRLKG